MSRKRQEQRRERERQRRQREQELAKRQAGAAQAAQATQQTSAALNNGLQAFAAAIGVPAAYLGPAAEEPEAPGPTFSECVIGYRYWLLDPTGQLRAITMTKQAWQPGTNTAHCRPNDHGHGAMWSTWLGLADETHPAPAKDCHCGLYGWNDLSDDYTGANEVDASARLVVLGAIAAWGDLRVHHKGFRAQHACIVALALAPATSQRVRDTLQRVAGEYRVPLVHADTLQAEAERHGTPLPEHVRPSPPPPSSHRGYIITSSTANYT